VKNATVGTRFSAVEVISKGTDLLKANPSIILIQAVPAIPALIGDLAGSAALFSPLVVVFSIISAILGLIASGAYAPVVNEALSGQRLTIAEALGHAGRRFWSLLGAAVLVVIIVALGTIAFVVPGIIFATWYAYTAPAIMLENKGALDGMSASRAFGRDKKVNTFLVFLVFFVVYVVISIIGAVLSIGGGGRIISTLLEVPLAAWTSVILAYIYIAHGPMGTGTPASTSGAPSLTPGQGVDNPTFTPAPVSTPASSRVCSSCGAPLKPDSKFCSSCGKPV